LSAASVLGAALERAVRDRGDDASLWLFFVGARFDAASRFQEVKVRRGGLLDGVSRPPGCFEGGPDAVFDVLDRSAGVVRLGGVMGVPVGGWGGALCVMTQRPAVGVALAGGTEPDALAVFGGWLFASGQTEVYSPLLAKHVLLGRLFGEDRGWTAALVGWGSFDDPYLDIEYHRVIDDGAAAALGPESPGRRPTPSAES
jgi:hypothetical protein